MAAVLLRVAALIAYRPALFFSDSWRYASVARTHTVAGFYVPGFDTLRPSGYPAILDLLAVVSRHAMLISVVQHVAGLVIGILVYALVRRLGASRAIAAAASAVVLLDSYAIALEQYVLSETFFALCLVGSFFLITNSRAGRGAIVASGVLLACAATLRTVGVVAVPLWLAYVLVAGRGRRQFAIALAAVAVPLALYVGAHAAAGRGFQITESSGWFLYGRVGQIADCSRFNVSPDEQPLCRDTRPPGHQKATPRWFIWDLGSPANKEFGAVTGLSPPEMKRSNRILRDFALKTIVSRPGAYARMVGGEFARFFEPGKMSTVGVESNFPITFLDQPQPSQFNAALGDRYFAVGSPPAVHPPAHFLRTYQRFVHTPRWLMAAFGLAGLLVLLLAIPRNLRAHFPRRAEVLLLVGTGLLFLLATVATASFSVRYLVPAAPLLVTGGIAALLDLSPLATRLWPLRTQPRATRAMSPS
ncbi:MAG TPA: phospholipid carrier-dependent glycosyltransferase [Thermoleophilaceae bacterium]|nr:phospholipid carrier-dependent glycosyltransferase [Thermoleophilaceae bacterium]